MSRIGKSPVAILPNVQVNIGPDNLVTVKGPKGQLERKFPETMRFTEDDGTLVVTRPNDEKQQRALHGLSRSLLNNMVVGVANGFTTTLDVQGVGYRAQLQGRDLNLALGFSHPVLVSPPEGIEFQVEGNRIHVTGIDKELVGQVAANIREWRKPEPYKGKGIRYKGEYIFRKEGKKK